MRHPFITAQLLQQARTTSIETKSRPAQDAFPDRRVRRLLAWGSVILLVTLVALGVPLPAGAAHTQVTDERDGQAVERTLAREHHAVPVPADQAAKAAQRMLAREHHAVPAPTGQQAPNAQRAKPAGTSALLAVIVGVGLIVVLAAAVTLTWRRARPREAT